MRRRKAKEKEKGKGKGKGKGKEKEGKEKEEENRNRNGNGNRKRNGSDGGRETMRMTKVSFSLFLASLRCGRSSRCTSSTRLALSLSPSRRPCSTWPQEVYRIWD